MPYFPPSVDDLPATRFILFSDSNNKTRIIDESEVDRQGFSFTGIWETPTLNRKDRTKEYTLRKCLILYEAAEDTTISLYPTGDGGASYGTPVILTLTESDDSEVKRAVGGFNTTGFDLRVRFDFDTDAVVTVYGYKATVVERSDILIS